MTATQELPQQEFIVPKHLMLKSLDGHLYSACGTMFVIESVDDPHNATCPDCLMLIYGSPMAKANFPDVFRKNKP